MRRDPVCRRRIGGKKIHATVRYGGESFPTCSASCKEAFEKAPSRYVGRAYPTDDDMRLVMAVLSNRAPELAKKAF